MARKKHEINRKYSVCIRQYWKSTPPLPTRTHICTYIYMATLATQLPNLQCVPTWIHEIYTVRSMEQRKRKTSEKARWSTIVMESVVIWIQNNKGLRIWLLHTRTHIYIMYIHTDICVYIKKAFLIKNNPLQRMKYKSIKLQCCFFIIYDIGIHHRNSNSFPGCLVSTKVNGLSI